MRFPHDSKLYSITFHRFVPAKAKRVRTMAVLDRSDSYGHVPNDWKEVEHVVVCHHSEDTFSKEDGRRAALRKLANTLLEKFTPDKALVGKMLAAYFNRPHTKDINALRDQIRCLEKQVLELEKTHKRFEQPKAYIM